MSQSLFNSGLLLPLGRSKACPNLCLACHNPFSIQVYYYNTMRSALSLGVQCTSSQSLFNSGLLLLSGLRFPGRMKLLRSQSLFNSGLLLRKRRWRISMERWIGHNPFSIQVYYYCGIYSCQHSYPQEVSQSLFNSGLLLRRFCLQYYLRRSETVTIPFQFRSIITEQLKHICLLGNVSRHNPFSIQVYYYEVICYMHLHPNRMQSHNPFSIQVYYYWVCFVC